MKFLVTTVIPPIALLGCFLLMASGKSGAVIIIPMSLIGLGQMYFHFGLHKPRE